MAAAQRDRPSALTALREAVANAPRSRFFSLITLLERLTPDAERIGGPGPPEREAIRFRHDPDLSFSAGDVRSARLLGGDGEAAEQGSTDGVVAEVVTTFLGLTGAASPLPLHLLEEVVQEDDQEPTRRDFLDIFHHRAISLLYRLWSRYDYAREYRADMGDPWTLRSLALAGVNAYAARSTTGLPPSRLLQMMPLLVQRSRGERALQLALEDVLGEQMGPVKVRIRPFTGRWVPVDPSERLALGRRNSRLGMDARLGARAYDRSGQFRIRIEPSQGDQYERLLSDGDLLPLVRETVELILTDPLELELEVVIEESAVPTMRLSAERGSRLGRDSWLRGGRRGAQSLEVTGVSSAAVAS